jgi:hypothetical protein
MALLESASSYILSIITEDETVKNFPKEFISEAALWVRSWFLKDDPKTEAKIKDENNSTDKKKGIIETKLEDLLENETIKAELEKRLKAFETQKTKRKGVVENSNIEVQGGVHIGDTGIVANEIYDEKNIVKGSTIKAGGDFRLGDDVFSGNENVQIIHNYFGGKKASDAPASGIKAEVQKLISEGKTEKAIEVLLDAPAIEDDLHTQILLQSGRMNHLNRQVNKGVLSDDQSKAERAKINVALLALVKEIES